ncbi:MAG: ribonuclease HII [Bacteroidales bacterium]
MTLLSENYSGLRPEAGCDEAGRGSLAGPVTAAAVILAEGFNHPLLNDSKKLTVTQREEARKIIEENALSYHVAFVEADEIDRINILNAALKAMHLALRSLKPQPAFIIVDGNRFHPYGKIPSKCIVKGDGKYASIAAASILAKCYRDRKMEELHLQWPQYGWVSNKGYATQAHIRAIEEYGLSPLHRRTFHLKRQLRLPF